MCFVEGNKRFGGTCYHLSAQKIERAGHCEYFLHSCQITRRHIREGNYLELTTIRLHGGFGNNGNGLLLTVLTDLMECWVWRITESISVSQALLSNKLFKHYAESYGGYESLCNRPLHTTLLCTVVPDSLDVQVDCFRNAVRCVIAQLNLMGDICNE